MLICILFQLNVKHQIHSILENPETKLEKITLTHEEYRKARLDNREIILEGNLFDIKEITTFEDYVELLAYNDTKEEGLISIIENLFSDENSKNEFTVQVLKLLLSVFTFEKQAVEFTSSVYSDTYGSFLQVCYHSFPEDTFNPPPEI